MSKRKTVSIEFLINMVNDICKDTSADRASVRQGAMNVLETVLHSTGNYRGYRYLLKTEVVDGNPGVNYQGFLPHMDYTERFKDTDKTRVKYYSNSGLST